MKSRFHPWSKVSSVIISFLASVSWQIALKQREIKWTRVSVMMMTVPPSRWIKKIFFRTARQFHSSKLNFPAHWLRWWSPDLMFWRQTKDEKCLGVRDIDTLGTRASNAPLRSLTLYNHEEGWKLKLELKQLLPQLTHYAKLALTHGKYTWCYSDIGNGWVV